MLALKQRDKLIGFLVDLLDALRVCVEVSADVKSRRLRARVMRLEERIFCAAISRTDYRKIKA